MAAFSTADTFRLGGTSNATFDVSQIGAQYQGFGIFEKAGSSTWTLIGTGAVATPWTISVGTLQLGNGGTSGSILGNVVDNGTFAIKRSDTYTFGGVISGTGAFQQLGAGTTILSGNNTYTGGTTISAGTLSLFGTGNLGTTSGATTVAGGTLNLGGTAQTQNGGVTLAGGTIQNGTLSSSGAFNMQSGSVSAALAGTGALTKTTAATVILSGANTYGGQTAINAGTLEVDGSIANSATTVNSGAVLTA